MASKVYLGSTNLDLIKNGSSDLRLYLGSELVYPLTTPSTTFKYKVKYINVSTGDETVVEVPDDGTTTITQGMIQSDLQALGYNSMLFSEITFGSNITTIGSLAMLGTSSLSSVTLNNVTTLADHAFTVDDNMPTNNQVTTINIPASVTSISSTALIDMPLTSITVDSGNTKYTVEANTLVANGTTAVKGTKNSDFSNMLNITKIGSHAFEGVLLNSGFDLLPNVEYIGNYAFYRCHLPSGYNSIMVGSTYLSYVGIAAFATFNNWNNNTTTIDMTPLTSVPTFGTGYIGGNGIFGGNNAARIYVELNSSSVDVCEFRAAVESADANTKQKTNIDHIVDPSITITCEDYDEQYLTTESLEDGNTISFTMGTGMTTAITTAVTSVSVSTNDGVTWTSMENIGANASLSVTLDAGEKAIWKGEALGYSIATASTRSTVFSSTGNYKVYGNITSLLYDDNFLNQDNPTLPDFNCFANLFYGSTGLTDASNLIMHFVLASLTKRPLGFLFQGCTSLVKVPELKNIDFANTPYAFRDMFHGCTSLTTAPELPATTLANNCYQNMFQGCTSLTTAPELPATTLTNSCYYAMFYGCTGLTTAPELSATTLASGCYAWMFNGCTSLTTAPELPATTLADGCYNSMLQGTNVLPDTSNIDFTSEQVVASGGLKGLFDGTNVTDNDLMRILPKNSNDKYCLPVTTLAKYCYQNMFNGCTSLVTAPELPATTLAQSCYSNMFKDCTSLVNAPELPARTLAQYCYSNMFQGCTSLTTAPELPATALVSTCYYYMFASCTSLNYIKCLATNISAKNCTKNWVSGVDGVAVSGTFVKAASMSSWTTGVDGIPTGWTVQDAD